MSKYLARTIRAFRSFWYFVPSALSRCDPRPPSIWQPSASDGSASNVNTHTLYGRACRLDGVKKWPTNRQGDSWNRIEDRRCSAQVLACESEQHKMRSQLTAQFMPFFRLIARILTFRDKKYRILTFRDKKYRILTFRDKTESYLTVLQQNNAEAC